MADNTFQPDFPKKRYVSTGELAVYEVLLVNKTTKLAYINQSRQYRDEGLLWNDADSHSEIRMSVIGWRKIEVPTVIEGKFFRAEKVNGQWEAKAINFENDKRIHYSEDYNSARKRLGVMDQYEQHIIKKEVELRLGRRLTLEELIKNHGYNPNFNENKRYYPLIED